jgi:glycosyltransferase involved in cell wall biosynthesis
MQHGQNGADVKLIPHLGPRLGLEGIVSHSPSVPDSKIPRLFASADVFVLPSIPALGWEERFGMVLTASMACGTAIITARSGAIPEVLGDAAVLVAPGNYRALAQAMTDLLLDERQQAHLSAAAASRARDLFDPQVFVDPVLKIYEELHASN